MKLQSQKGVAVVEFAVILPLLLLIVFGIVEFGFIFYNQAILTNASREGARRAIVFQTDSDANRIYSGTAIEDAVNQYLYTDYPANTNLRLVTFGNNNLTIDLNCVDDEISITQRNYNYNMGKLLNSGVNLNIANTGGWTSFSQPCDVADANEMKSLICGGGNPGEIKLAWA